VKTWGELETTIAAEPAIKSCEIIEQIKSTDDSDVFVALVNDAKVVIKLFHAETANERVRNLKLELDFVSQTMATGRNQVNQCLHILPKDGIAVLSFAPGQSVSRSIRSATPTQREELILHSAEWLQEYTNLRQKVGRLGPWHWLKQLENIDVSAVKDSENLRLLATLLGALQKQAKKHAQCDMVKAAGHGDFSGVNLHFYDGVMYGLDIQTESWYAIANEAAQYLTFIQAHNNSILQQSKFGIYSADWNAFFKSGILSDTEQGTTVPFFIGVHFYRHLVRETRRPRMQENIAYGIERYLVDLSEINT
jgi:hypothetical protein